MQNKLILKLKIISFSIFFFQSQIFASENQDFVKHKLDVFLLSENTISIKNIKENKIIKGTLLGKVENKKNEIFHNANLECDILGHAYKGRSFSCGFAEVEDLQGYCKMTFPGNENILLINYKCTTTAGMEGDAVCKGKINVLQGFGEYAGAIGFGKLEMPLINSILGKKTSIPMRLQINLKKQLLLKSQLSN